MANPVIFNPLTDTNDQLRAKFWDTYAKDFTSIRDALSSYSYFKGELRLCRNYLTPKNRQGKLLKLDLWNEVHHTPLIESIWKNYEAVYAVDIAPSLVTRAAKILQAKKIPVKTKIGDIRKLPYASNYFDYVYTMGTIEHIPRPIDAMREIFRVLKPGGRAVIGVPNKYEWFGKSIILDILADTGFKEDGRELSFGWRQLRSELQTCGFIIVAETGTYFMPWFIRLIDWYLYQKSTHLKYVMVLPIWMSDLISEVAFFRKHGSLLAAVVEKPYGKKTGKD